MREGDIVRDRAGLGGVVVWVMYGSVPLRVRVSWNNGMTSWIDAKWLTVI